MTAALRSDASGAATGAGFASLTGGAMGADSGGRGAAESGRGGAAVTASDGGAAGRRASRSGPGCSTMRPLGATSVASRRASLRAVRPRSADAASSIVRGASGFSAGSSDRASRAAPPLKGTPSTWPSPYIQRNAKSLIPSGLASSGCTSDARRSVRARLRPTARRAERSTPRTPLRAEIRSPRDMRPESPSGETLSLRIRRRPRRSLRPRR